MLPFDQVNIVAVLIASFLAMGLGMFWYSPAAFGKLWMELTGITEEDAKSTDMKVMMPKSFISTFVGIYVLALLVIIIGPANLQEGALLAVVLLLALPVPMEISGVLWEKRPAKLMYINLAYSLVSTLVSVGVLMSMG